MHKNKDHTIKIFELFIFAPISHLNSVTETRLAILCHPIVHPMSQAFPVVESAVGETMLLFDNFFPTVFCVYLYIFVILLMRFFVTCVKEI